MNQAAPKRQVTRRQSLSPQLSTDDDNFDTQSTSKKKVKIFVPSKTLDSQSSLLERSVSPKKTVKHHVSPQKFSKPTQKSLAEVDKKFYKRQGTTREQAYDEKPICTNSNCALGPNPHKHTLPSCQDHTQCMAETIKEQIPIENNLPLPLPSHALGLETGSFAKDVEAGKFAETGPVRPGTKIVPTKYSLDHYMAQQWNLDVDKMPVSVPDFLSNVHENFAHHCKRSNLERDIKMKGQMTLKKKMEQWSHSIEQMHKQSLELMYIQSDMNPRLQNMIKNDQKQPRSSSRQQKNDSATNFSLKYAKPDRFNLEFPKGREAKFCGDKSKDMVTLAIPKTRQVTPIINELNKEHQRFQKQFTGLSTLMDAEMRARFIATSKMMGTNSSAGMSLLTRAGSVKKVKDSEAKKKLGAADKRQSHSLMNPPKQIRDRLKSEHLAFLQSSEIVESGLQQIEYYKLLQKMKAEGKKIPNDSSQFDQQLENVYNVTDVKTIKARIAQKDDNLSQNGVAKHRKLSSNKLKAGDYMSQNFCYQGESGGGAGEIISKSFSMQKNNKTQSTVFHQESKLHKHTGSDHFDQTNNFGESTKAGLSMDNTSAILSSTHHDKSQQMRPKSSSYMVTSARETKRLGEFKSARISQDYSQPATKQAGKKRKHLQSSEWKATSRNEHQSLNDAHQRWTTTSHLNSTQTRFKKKSKSRRHHHLSMSARPEPFDSKYATVPYQQDGDQPKQLISEMYQTKTSGGAPFVSIKDSTDGIGVKHLHNTIGSQQVGGQTIEQPNQETTLTCLETNPQSQKINATKRDYQLLTSANQSKQAYPGQSTQNFEKQKSQKPKRRRKDTEAQRAEKRQQKQVSEAFRRHFTSSKTCVRMSSFQKNKVSESTSFWRQGNQMLQEQLSAYGIAHKREYAMPKECQTILNEVPDLIRNRNQREQRFQKEQAILADRCKFTARDQKRKGMVNFLTQPNNNLENYKTSEKNQEQNKQQLSEHHPRVADLSNQRTSTSQIAILNSNGDDSYEEGAEFSVTAKEAPQPPNNINDNGSQIKIQPLNEEDMNENMMQQQDKADEQQVRKVLINDTIDRGETGADQKISRTSLDVFKEQDDQEGRAVAVSPPRMVTACVQEISQLRKSRTKEQFMERILSDPKRQAQMNVENDMRSNSSQATLLSPMNTNNQSMKHHLKQQSTAQKQSSASKPSILGNAAVSASQNSKAESKKQVPPKVIIGKIDPICPLGATNGKSQESIQAFQGSLPKLRDVEASILAELKSEKYEESSQISLKNEIPMADPTFDPIVMRQHVQDMESVDFWLQRGVSESNKGNIEAAMDYFKQGLRKNPTNLVLIYCLANAYKKLKKFNSTLIWFSHGVNLSGRWVDGLCGLATTHFTIGNFKQALRYISQAKDNFRGSNASETKLSFETINFIKATCLKMEGQNDAAQKQYKILDDVFKAKLGADLAGIVWGLFLTPLSNDRKVTADQLSYLREYIDYKKEVPRVQQENHNLMLSRYCTNQGIQNQFTKISLTYHVHNQPPPKLQWNTYPDTILEILSQRSFFKRFNSLSTDENKLLFRQSLQKVEVELYEKDQVLFLNNRIGVVICGSIELRVHDKEDFLKPVAVRKVVEGDILGFSDGDGGISSCPLSWLVAMQTDTEVLFFEKKDFAKIWGLQLKMTEQQIVIQKLEQNRGFSQLDLLTKYSLVYESLEEQTFYPGELIMSVHQRSPLCIEFQEYYKDRMSAFRQRIEAKMVNSVKDDEEKGQDIISQSHGPEFVNSPLSSVDQTFDSPKNQEDKRKDQKGKNSKFEFEDKNSLKTEIYTADGKNMETNEFMSSCSDFSNDTDFGMQDAQNIIRQNLQLERDLLSSPSLTSQGSSSEDLSLESNSQIFEVEEQSEDTGSQNDLQRVKTTDAKELLATDPFIKGEKKKKLNAQLGKSLQLKPLQGKNFNNDNIVRFSLEEEQLSIVKQSSAKEKLKQKSPKKRKIQINVSQEDDEANLANKIQQNSRRSRKAGEYQMQLIEKKRSIPQHKQQGNFMKYELETHFKKAQEISVHLKTFTLQKQLEKLKQRDQNMIQTHLTRKATILNLSKQISFQFQAFKASRKVMPLGKQPSLKRVFSNEPVLKREITGLMTSMNSKENLQSNKLPKRSGFQNIELVKNLARDLQQVQDIFTENDIRGNEEINLFKVLVEQIELAEQVSKGDKWAYDRREATGVHFIEAGEVVVVGSDVAPISRLSKCDSFGMCELTKKVGPEYLGDIRASLKIVHTFYVPYEDMRRRLSIPERLKLQKSAFNMTLIDMQISQISEVENVPQERLRKF